VIALVVWLWGFGSYGVMTGMFVAGVLGVSYLLCCVFVDGLVDK
jgi:hypothetical protein